MARILCVGAAVVDFVFNLDDLPRRPEKYSTESATIVGGGCAANAAVAISRLGGQAILAARLGQDDIANLILADLKAEGVDVSKVTRTDGAQSSFSSVFVDRSGDRQIVNFRGRGLILRTDWFDALPQLDAVLADTRRVKAAIDAMDLARARSVPGIVDGEAPVDPRILERASHAAFSMQGLQSLRPGEPIEQALGDIATQYRCWACVTDGAAGVWYTTPGGVEHLPAMPIRAVDTLAAGDVWHGAFALALAENREPSEAVRMASAAAALKCLKPGGRAGAPTRAELYDFLKETLE